MTDLKLDAQAATLDTPEQLVTDQAALEQQQALMAQRVPGTSNFERVQAEAAVARKYEDESALSVFGESMVRTATDLNIASAISREVIDRSKLADDPTWDPRRNPDQMQFVKTHLEGVPLEFQDDIISAGSKLGVMTEADYVRRELATMQYASETTAGTAGMMLASMLDVDNLVPQAGMFAKIGRVAKLGKFTNELQSSSRLKNAATVAAETGVAVGVGESINAILRPTVDVSDVFGAVIMSSAGGAALGSLLPTKNIQQAADDSFLSKLVREQLRREKNAGGYNRPNRMVDLDNNPAKLKIKDDLEVPGYKGLADDGVTAKFETPEDGIRALHTVTRSYGEKDVISIRDLVRSYVEDGDIDSYVAKVSKESGLDPDQLVNLGDLNTSEVVLSALIKATNPDAKVTRSMLREGINRSLMPDGDESYYRSVGAASANSSAPIYKVSPTTAKWLDEADAYFEQRPDVLFELYNPDKDFGDAPVQRLAKSINTAINKTGLRSDFERLRATKSITGLMLNHKLLESPIGIARNSRSANNLANHMHDQITAEVLPNVGHYYRNWAKDRGYKMWDVDFHSAGEAKFAREVMEEMENRRWGQPSPDAHASVTAMAEDFDRANAKALMYAKGYNGEPGIKGMEDIPPTPGWFQRDWQNDKLSKIEREVGINKIQRSLANGLVRANAEMDDDMALIISKAIIRSTKNKDVSREMQFGAFGKEGQSFIAQAIKDHRPDLTDEDVLTIMDKALGMSTEKRPSFAQKRLDIDMRTSIEGTDYKLMDLIDTDVLAVQERYFRKVSNQSALARVGIQVDQVADLKKAVIEETRMLGTYDEKLPEFMDDLFSYFGDGAYAGGAGAFAGRLNKLAIMSYLGQLGITQLAEVGAVMGMSINGSFAKHAKQSIPDMLRGKDVEALKSLQAIGVYTGDHRHVIRNMSAEDMDVETSSKFLKGVDAWSDKGIRGLGYASGFYKVNDMLNAMAALTVQDFIVRSLQTSKNLNRLRDIGVNDDFMVRVNKYIDNGTIEFDAAGLVKDMHYERWDPVDSEDIALAIRTHMRQVVQKTQRGEGQNWAYKNLGSLFMSLKSFTVTAAQKQVVRNMRHGDPYALQTLLYGTLSASMAYSAREIVNGRGDDLSPAKVAVGAMQWGNMTSPALMVIDPFTYLLGADKIPGSPFPLNGWRYGAGGLLSMPAGISAANQLLNLPRIPSDLMDDGELGADSINALKAVPVVGRSYPMIPILNNLQGD